MQKIVLMRKEFLDDGTFGELVLGPKVFQTGELPYRDIDKDSYSDSDYSCIAPSPTQKDRLVYPAKVTFSNRFKKDLYELSNTEKRFSIRIHSANFMGDAKKINPKTGNPYKCQLNGCIALGGSVGERDGQRAILGSKKAVEEFMAILANQPFELEIYNA